MRLARTVFFGVTLGLLAACAAEGPDEDAPSPDATPLEPYETVAGDVDRADEVTSGEGWELLDAREIGPQWIGAELAGGASDVARAWERFFVLDEDPPQVDHQDQLVVVVPAPSDCETVLRDVELGATYEDDLGGDVDVIRLVAQTPETCPDEEPTGRMFTLAVDRSTLESPRIEVRVGDVSAALEDRTESLPGTP